MSHTYFLPQERIKKEALDETWQHVSEGLRSISWEWKIHVSKWAQPPFTYRNCTQNQNWVCFVHFLKSSTFFLETKCSPEVNCLTNSKMAFTRKSSGSWGSWVIDQNNILQVLINNSTTAGHTNILMPFLISQTICFQIIILFFKKKCW